MVIFAEVSEDEFVRQWHPIKVIIWLVPRDIWHTVRDGM